MKTIQSVKILGTGSYAPEQVVSNHMLASKLDTTDSWIVDKLGIHERRVSTADEWTSHLATEAGKRALSAAGLTPEDLDLVIVCTSTPDRLAPSTACFVQSQLKATKAAAFDLNAVCSGFMYGSTVATQFVATGAYRNVLVIGADTFSKITDWERRDSVFFGDGAGAAVFSAATEGNGFLASALYADGNGADAWTIPAGGSELPASEETIKSRQHFFQMDGRAVFETATTVLPEVIEEVLDLAELSMSDIKYVIPHQPSIRILMKTAEILGVSFDKFLTNMDRYANTSGGTIPILLDETVRSGKLSPGDYVLFCAVGSGWTWGASVLRWE